MHTSHQWRAPAGFIQAAGEVDVNPDEGGGKDKLGSEQLGWGLTAVCPLTFMAAQHHLADVMKMREAPTQC